MLQNPGKSLPERRMVGEHKVLVLWMLLEVERNYSYLHIAQKWLTFWQIPGWQVTLDLSLLDGLFTLLSKLLQMQNTFFLKCLFWVQYQIFQVRTILIKFQQKRLFTKFKCIWYFFCVWMEEFFFQKWIMSKHNSDSK